MARVCGTYLDNAESVEEGFGVSQKNEKGPRAHKVQKWHAV